MSATHSDHFDTDLTKLDGRARGKALGEIIRLAREHGATVRHRPAGWTTVVNGETKHWWPAQANLFADYLADAIRDALVIQ